MVMPGICEKKSQFISKLQRRYGGARSARAPRPRAIALA